MKLIDDWRQSWRMWSMRLNAVASIAVTYVLASPEVLLGALNSLPPEFRAIFPPLAGIGLFMLVTLTRLAKQKPRDND